MAALADDAARTALEIVHAEPTIGELLRAMRTARGWSQERLALESGVSHTTISKTEQGRRRPIVTACERLADVFGLRGVERERFVAWSTPLARAPHSRFGWLLQRYRLRAGYSQYALAAIIGVDGSWLNRLEVEARQATAKLVREIANVLALTTPETDALLVAAGFVPSYAADRTVRQLVAILTGDAVLAAAVRCQVQALFRMTQEGDEA